jgi:hypothetical protein
MAAAQLRNRTHQPSATKHRMLADGQRTSTALPKWNAVTAPTLKKTRNHQITDISALIIVGLPTSHHLKFNALVARIATAIARMSGALAFSSLREGAPPKFAADVAVGSQAEELRLSKRQSAFPLNNGPRRNARVSPFGAITDFLALLFSLRRRPPLPGSFRAPECGAAGPGSLVRHTGPLSRTLRSWRFRDWGSPQ